MKALASAVGGGSAKKEIKIERPPEPEPAAPMPDPEEERRAAAREELKRRKTGRYSTLLSDDDGDKL